jgi:hypothetical protein
MSGNPHPMLVYQGKLYVADKNNLNTIDSSGNIVIGVLALNSNEIIYALGIDPYTGLMMISVQTTVNISDTLTSQFFIYLYDGISSKALRKIPVDDLVTGFLNVEGTVYCGSGIVLGQWNGNGVSFLRRLQNAGFAQADLMYKHHMAKINRILHVADGKNILSYGTVIAGKPKAFFYTANIQNSSHADLVCPLGGSDGNVQLAVAGGTHSMQQWDFTSTSAGTGYMPFAWIWFPRPVYIRRIRIITTGFTTNLGGIGNNYFITDKQKTIQCAQPTFIITATASPQYVFDFDYTTNIAINGMQPITQLDTQSCGLIRMHIYYDIAE